MIVDLGSASFISFNVSSLKFMIADLSSIDVISGFYILSITLDDGQNTVSDTLNIEIQDPIDLPPYFDEPLDNIFPLTV